VIFAEQGARWIHHRCLSKLPSNSKYTAGDAAALATLKPDGRLASALGATSEQIGRGDITVTPVVAVAQPEKLSSLLDAVAAGAVTVPIVRSYDLDQSPPAISDFAGHKLGKLVTMR
jgi:hypothetical protein